METQKIVNLLNDSENDPSKFSTRKWYIINDQNNGQYGRSSENDSTIKFETKAIKPNLCDYSDGYILVTGDIKVENVAAHTNVVFKNCAPFTRYVTHINDEHVETAENLDINMPMYNLIEYSLLTTRQTTKLRNAIENNISTDIKLSKAQISKMIQSGGFLGSLLSKIAGPLMKVAVPLAKNVLAPLGITAAASAIDGTIQKKIHVSGTTTLIISNEEMNDIMKIVQALKDSNILLKGVAKTINNETKKQKGGFLSMLLGTFGASLLGNLLTRKGIVRTGEEIVRAGYGSSVKKKRSNSTTFFKKF